MCNLPCESVQNQPSLNILWESWASFTSCLVLSNTAISQARPPRPQGKSHQDSKWRSCNATAQGTCLAGHECVMVPYPFDPVYATHSSYLYFFIRSPFSLPLLSMPCRERKRERGEGGCEARDACLELTGCLACSQSVRVTTENDLWIFLPLE